MTDLELLRKKSLLYSEEKLYEIFFLEYTKELEQESGTYLRNASDDEYIVVIDCKAFPMVAHLSARDFIDSIQNSEAHSTQNHRCYFCNYGKDDDYVTFMKGFLKAHKSCERIVRSNLQEFIEKNNDVFTANVI